MALTIGYSAVIASRLREEYDIGTIVVNLCGTSTTGKSTAVMLMTAPFMCPEISNKGIGSALTSLATENALYAQFDGYHGVQFVVDDITTNSKLNLTDFIYALALGTPKARCNGDGTLRDGGYGWSGVSIVSSEEPILNLTKAFQGLKVRVLQTEGIQWTSDAEEAELVKRTVSKNYGFTGKEFAQYISQTPIEELCERYESSFKAVSAMMTKKDALSSRLANKYAVVHVTANLLNEAFGYSLSADAITKRIIKCEQDTFEERDNATKALDVITDFIIQKESHFHVDYRMYSVPLCYETYATGDVYGKIFKYDDRWDVHILSSLVNSLLKQKGLDEINWIRTKWAERNYIKTDGDHTAKKKKYADKPQRYVCFTFPGGIKLPTFDESPRTSIDNIPQNTPISTYTVDDTAQIEQIIGGNDEN